MYLIRMFEEGGTQGGVDPNVLIGLVVFLIVFFLMVVLGWWASSKGLLKKEEEPKPVDHGHDEHAHTAHVEVAHTAGAPSAHADDLTTLEGIGPKVARLLAGIGISTFAGLAKADITKIRAALDAAGYKYMEPAGWIEQAALAAKGDKAGLAKLQNSLKGGRKVA